MRIGMTAALILAALAACRRPDYRTTRDVGEPQIVALSVRTQPAGATVRVNRIDRVWTTPCDVADFSIGRGQIEVQVSLEGFETVSTKVPYDGEHPATLKLKLRATSGAAAKEPTPGPEPEKPIVVKLPEPPPPAAKAPEPPPAPVTLEPAAGGTRVKVATSNAKVRIQAKSVVVVSEPDRPGELFIPDAPAGKTVIELLDPKTEAVIASVEFERSAPPVKPPVALKDPVAAEADRVGEVKLVHKTYGVFVKLDPGLSLQPGEEIIVFRAGREVARTKILKITAADGAYPDGAAEVRIDGSIQKGDEVRRSKP